MRSTGYDTDPGHFKIMSFMVNARTPVHRFTSAGIGSDTNRAVAVKLDLIELGHHFVKALDALEIRSVKRARTGGVRLVFM